jgi:biopolymer transport protein ExbD
MKIFVKKRDASIPTTSMGDIAFLLIIFFMLCSNFVREKNVELKPPRSSDIVRVKEAPMSVSIDKNKIIYLQGKAVSDAEAVEWGVSALLHDKLSREVMFKCDASISAEVFEPVIEAISKAGGIILAAGEKQ